MYRLLEADHYINKKILIVGVVTAPSKPPVASATQSAISHALLPQRWLQSHQERNSQRIEESVRKGKVKVIFNSAPVEFKENSVLLESMVRRRRSLTITCGFRRRRTAHRILEKDRHRFSETKTSHRTGSKEAKQAKTERQAALSAV